MQNQLSNKSTLWGMILIAAGAFFLLQVSGIFGALSSLFWSLAFAAGGAVFLYVFFTGLHTRWWAAIPGFTLLGLAATIFYGRFAPPFFANLGGAVFLGAIATAFIAIFFTNREQWWAIIPGGVLMSVAAVVVVANSGIGFLNPASILFIGIGVTFGLLGLMSTYLNTNLRWAYIPAAIMLIMGIVVFTPFVGMLGWIWPLALIGGGAWLILRRPDLPKSTHGAMLPNAATTVNAATAAQAPGAADASISQVNEPAEMAEMR